MSIIKMKEYTHYKSNVLEPTICGYTSTCRYLGTRISFSRKLVDCSDCLKLLEETS